MTCFRFLVLIVVCITIAITNIKLNSEEILLSKAYVSEYILCICIMNIIYTKKHAVMTTLIPVLL